MGESIPCVSGSQKGFEHQIKNRELKCCCYSVLYGALNFRVFLNAIFYEMLIFEIVSRFYVYIPYKVKLKQTTWLTVKKIKCNFCFCFCNFLLDVHAFIYMPVYIIFIYINELNRLFAGLFNQQVTLKKIKWNRYK